MPIAVYALALMAFAIGTTEFIVSGILPAISGDLSVSIPTAGLLVTGYAAGVAVGGPILALLTARFPAKPVLLVLGIVFALGQALCAIAPDYALLMGARLVSACGHGVFFGIGSVTVSRLVPENRRGSALSLFVGGITVANILGVPAGTAIGNAFGWRVSFVCIAAMALLAVLAIALALPGIKGQAEREAPLRIQAAQLRHPAVWTSYLIIAVVMVGSVSFGTFQVPLLIEVTRIEPGYVPLFLLLGGVGSVVGIFIGGRLADWRPLESLLGILLAQVACYFALMVSAHHPIAMGISLFASAAATLAFSTPTQVRIFTAARAAPNLASTFVSTAYNIGIAAGALLGAVLLNTGTSYATIPLIGVASSAIAALITTACWLSERRTLAIA
jgi:DHA1 family inner membrane transport protein